MRFSLAVVATLFSVVYAADHPVTVGNGALAFSPTSVTAAAGDTITFSFYPKNHTVTQSTFAAPCVASGIDSGFQAVAAGAASIPQWTITVQDPSTPLWFYCRQEGHCTQGMVFAVNPTAEKTFEAFQNAATGGASANSTGSASASASGGASSGAAASGATIASSVAATGAISTAIAGAATTSAAAGTSASAAPSASASTAASAGNGALGLSVSHMSILGLTVMMGLIL